MNNQSPDTKHYDAIVVGAGIAGLYQLYRLREAGYSVKVFDAGEGLPVDIAIVKRVAWRGRCHGVSVRSGPGEQYIRVRFVQVERRDD